MAKIAPLVAHAMNAPLAHPIAIAIAIATSVGAAYVRSLGAGALLDLDIGWSIFWLGSAMAAVSLLVYGATLAWRARRDQARLETHFRRGGAARFSGDRVDRRTGRS